MPELASPIRLPDGTVIEAAVNGLDPASAEVELVPALTAAFAEFAFSVARIADDDWPDARVRPPERDTGVLPRWADQTDGF